MSRNWDLFKVGAGLRGHGQPLLLLLLVCGIAANAWGGGSLAVSGSRGRGGGWTTGSAWARSGFYGADGGLNRGALPPPSGWVRSSDPLQRPSLDPGAVRPPSVVADPGSRSGSGGDGPAAGQPSIGHPWAAQPAWVRPGWGQARPWVWGWYGQSATPTWAWWPAQSARWGAATLASAAAIDAAISGAIASQQPVIAVPGTQGQLQLVFASVQPLGPGLVSFLAAGAAGGFGLTADCSAGLLNGQRPANLAQAELVNAACLVAFGPA
ncbi:MAG: hypothetical protein ACK5N0_10195 [Synechococcaceae cyanobacterium]